MLRFPKKESAVQFDEGIALRKKIIIKKIDKLATRVHRSLKSDATLIFSRSLIGVERSCLGVYPIKAAMREVGNI